LDDSHIEASFVTHAHVQTYLLDYQQQFELTQYIRYGCTVRHLKVLEGTNSKVSPPSENWPQIQLEWTMTETDGEVDKEGSEHHDIFDAVLVCNGHYAAPSSPDVPGLDLYFQGGRVMHSIEYDTPEPFKDQTVLCIGGRASGADIAREISCHAKHVYLSDTTCLEAENDGKVTLVPKTTLVDGDGRIHFDHDCPIQPHNVDTVILCSGYDYHFPFIDPETSNLDFLATPGERRVQPLVYQLWHATYPSLAFVGLPHSVVPFPLFEMQSEAVVAQWMKEYMLPNLDDRKKLATEDANRGGPKPNSDRVQDSHFLGDFQWGYCRQMVGLAQLSDNDSVDEYIRTNQALYEHAGAARKAGFPGGPDDYRSIRYSRSGWGEWKVLEEGSDSHERKNDAICQL
jgi:Flavin-binding monooxygenase-like